MKLTSHKILKAIVEDRETSLADLDPLIDKKFDDYRDYYPLAMLCTDGYIKCDWSTDDKPVTDEYSLASIFYSSISGEKKVGNYTAGNSPPPPEENKFFTAPKGELYFAEAKARRSDRIYSIAIGIIVGICTAILAVKLGVK